MNLFAITGIINGLVGGIEALIMFIKGKRKFHYLWGIFCFSVSIWGLGSYMIAITDKPADAIFWWKVTYVGVILIPIFLVHFTHGFLEITKRGFILLFYVLGTIFLILDLFSNFFINDVKFVFGQFYYISSPTFSYALFVLFFLGLAIYSLFRLWQYYKISLGAKRAQLKYIFAALLFGFMGGAVSFLPVYNINIYPAFNITASLGFSIVVYAIVVHRLMDIKLVFRRYSVFLFSLFTVTITALSIKYIFFTFFFDIFYWADFVVLVLAITFFPVIRDIFYRLANKHFFSSLYESQEVIATLSDKLRSTLELSTIFDFIHESLGGAFHSKSFGILGYNEKQDNYFIQYNQGFKVDKRKRFPNNSSLHKLFISRNEPMVVEEIRRAYYGQQTKDIIDLMIKYEVSILSPLNIKGKTIGLIVLGAKESGDMYNDEDLKVLRTVGAQAAISMENALLYRETINFNVKLAEEVERATFDLKAANEKLKKLDAAKSEFISIASHQLRTPLTVIKGYISMMLEGNFGKLTANESQALEKVYDSNERLIQLVENLLNISRIESGRLQFTYEVMNLEDLIESVFEELSNPAKKKGLALTFNHPAEPLPPVKIDEEKIRQVLMNLVDNAIKYTKKGAVTLDIKKSHNNIHFCVTDSGMGIDKSDMPNLFRKFSRGQGTSVVHTEGTGLGLYVARQMVKAHNGKIWAASAGKEKGAKFCFKIPINTD
ncbi:hypothetical protein COV49_02555 [Candidatus Falkowbacteria bacterium CG11_big_fil_rev_8_21_14_0_20_39_10]|uniref:histidine kinase n=1 Tax=Candidatus Falkowbacteria bacterium CG11_big_fil_rev_8_21_14_0_20_39_10 TaxID=1974570 RepID=A0A2M6K8U4_9BACT|nr:MAG: hypothetical protein COV49_02555 [Candidatus Falkowbacteria bacterium CG11_big_fil_rev_8_21_14_0_20_39_10]